MMQECFVGMLEAGDCKKAGGYWMVETVSWIHKAAKMQNIK